MKKYNVKNYVRYKNDIKASMPEDKPYLDYTRDELIIKFLPLVENMAHKFATSQQASGILDITDLIQEGSKGLIAAVDKIEEYKNLIFNYDFDTVNNQGIIFDNSSNSYFVEKVPKEFIQ